MPAQKQPLLKDEGQLPADREKKHGLHVDKWWPGLVHSIWKLGPVEVRRERKYHERNHQTLKLEGWLIFLRIRRHRVGVKWERDVA